MHKINLATGCLEIFGTAFAINPMMERRTFKRGLMTRAQMKGRLIGSPIPQNDQLWVWWLSPVASFFSGLMWGEKANSMDVQKLINSKRSK
jgi:hypothetical protein